MNNSNWRLDGKKAVITGGTKGIGLSCVEDFLELGAEVIFTARHQEELDLVVNNFIKKGFKVYGVLSDAAVIEDRIKLVEFTKKLWSNVDILVNNAGYNDHKPTLEYTQSEIKNLIKTNLLSTFDYCRYFFPLLKLSLSPCIINMASIAGLTNTSSGIPYAMSKAGIIQLTKNLATEWASFGIRVNCIAPGLIETPLTEFWKSNKNEALLKYFFKRVPMQQVGHVKEISGPLAFLAMPQASYINGQCITMAVLKK